MRVQVRSRVVLPASAIVPPGARLRLMVEDVTRADSSAVVVAAADFPFTTSRVPYVVTADIAPEPARFALRAHLDVNGDARVAPGDFVSVAHHAVPATAGTVELEVPLCIVRS
jgi:uncharacterized lipoprotein YbaY